MLCGALYKEYIVAYARRANQEWAELMQTEPCISMAMEAQTWLDKVITFEDVPSKSMPITPRAIEDCQS